MRSLLTRRITIRNKDRMNFRLDPEIKTRLARAAAISGQGLTDFAVSTLSERANEILERYDHIVLDKVDYDFFLHVLERDSNPSSKSKAAAQRYRKTIKRG